MTRGRDDLQARARKRLRTLRRKQRDPRFRNAMGRFVAEGLLETTIEGIRPHEKPVPLPARSDTAVIRMALELLEASTQPG